MGRPNNHFQSRTDQRSNGLPQIKYYGIPRCISTHGMLLEFGCTQNVLCCLDKRGNAHFGRSGTTDHPSPFRYGHEIALIAGL